MRRVLLSLVYVALATPAVASDGVLEINQTCAVETGCFPGDTAGFPVTITSKGSYRLTSDLALSLNVIQDAPSGISVSSSNVSIDLNGFAIMCQKSVLPSGTAPCDNGTGSGVRAGSVGSGVIVQNGIVDGFPLYGVSLGRECRIERLTVRNNGSIGIDVNARCAIQNNIAHDNGSHGIYGADGSVVTGNASSSNDDHGISVLGSSLVQGNVTQQNSGFGIFLLSASSGYRANIVSGNSLGSVDGGTNMGGNVCNGLLICE